MLLDLAEHSKENGARSARAEERSARAEEQAALALQKIATVSERAEIALQTIAASHHDLGALTQELRDANRRVDARLDAFEKVS